MKKVFVSGLFLIAAILFLVSCSSQTPTIALQSENTQTVQSDISSPVVTSSSTTTSGSGGSTITGIIQKPGGDPNDPALYVGIRVFLGDVLLSDDGQKAVGRGNPLEDPTAHTDEKGRFEFSNIEPGEYVLIVMVPPNDLFMLNHPTTQKNMIITVEADKYIDLGILEYDLPLPTNKDILPTETPFGVYPPPQSTNTAYPAPKP
jgi:hypothetical protein